MTSAQDHQKQRNPFPTVDIIIELPGDRVVLIDRKKPPQGIALPGGFIDAGEMAEEAAVREAREETGLHVELTGILGVYSDPARDPRRHTLTVVFLAQAQGKPEGGDDARHAFGVHVDELHQHNLVFDHGRIVADYVRFRAEGGRPNPMQRAADLPPGIAS